MPRDIMTKEVADAILRSADEIKRARVYDLSTQKPFSVQTLTIDLTTAKLSTDPLKLGFKFRSFFVSSASDSATTVNVKVNSRDDLQSSFPVKINDSCDFEEMVSEAYLDWSAQVGKSITFVFFTNALFRSGSQLSLTSGGVSISEGSAVGNLTQVALSATTATIIAPSNLSRKVCNIQNKTGASLYIGSSTIGAVGGANEGIEIPDKGIIYWKNTAALYGWSVAGGNISYFEEQ